MDEIRNNALRVLKLSPSATQEEIRSAYEALEERYSETEYLGSPLWDMAAEKRRLIREAYEVLCEEPAQAERMSAQAVSAKPAQAPSVSRQIRMCLNANELEKAQRLLDEQPGADQEAELIYLRGMLAWKRGWLDEAVQQIDRALSLCPRNREYQSAREKILYDSPPSTATKQYRQKTKAGRFCAACVGECCCELSCELLCEALCDSC